MAGDKIAREAVEDGCPECDSNTLRRSTIQREFGGIDWEKVYCPECGYKRVY